MLHIFYPPLPLPHCPASSWPSLLLSINEFSIKKKIPKSSDDPRCTYSIELFFFWHGTLRWKAEISSWNIEEKNLTFLIQIIRLKFSVHSAMITYNLNCIKFIKKDCRGIHWTLKLPWRSWGINQFFLDTTQSRASISSHVVTCWSYHKCKKYLCHLLSE